MFRPPVTFIELALLQVAEAEQRERTERERSRPKRPRPTLLQRLWNRVLVTLELRVS